ncbi:MAG: MOSC domain-containing protein [Candidatus Dormibacteria bacterium]
METSGKDALIERYLAARIRFEAALEAADLARPAGAWPSGLGLLNHVGFWSQEAARRIPMLLAGAPDEEYDFDAINAREANAAAGAGEALVRERYKRSHDAFMSALEAAPPDAFGVTGAAGEWVRAQASHLVEHALELQATVRPAPPVPDVAGTVTGIHLHPAPKTPLTRTESAEFVAGQGIIGDYHALPRPDGRHRTHQVNIVWQDEIALAASEVSLTAAPGLVRENLMVSGTRPPVGPGDRLAVGEAMVEVVKGRTPCSRMDEIRDGFQQALAGRVGVICRVVEGATVREGDRVMAVSPPSRAEERMHSGTASS